MNKRILIMQGHPDARAAHFGHALADAYADAAIDAGHQVDRVEVAQLVFPLIDSAEVWEKGPIPDAIKDVQHRLLACDHLVIVFPLWLGDMPAQLKGFLEQLFRPGVTLPDPAQGLSGTRPLKGKSARVVVTMGMPALVYRLFYRAHSVANLRRNILKFCGFRPVRCEIIGAVAQPSDTAHRHWLARMRDLGRRAA